MTASYHPRIDQRKQERLLTEAYKRLVGHLSAILYDEDPLGVGSGTVSGWAVAGGDDDRTLVPLDEYEAEAGRLAALLRQTDGDTDEALSAVFGGQSHIISDSLRARVDLVWRAHRAFVRMISD